MHVTPCRVSTSASRSRTTSLPISCASAWWRKEAAHADRKSNLQDPRSVIRSIRAPQEEIQRFFRAGRLSLFGALRDQRYFSGGPPRRELFHRRFLRAASGIQIFNRNRR